MFKGFKVGVVIPCFNEEANVANVITDLPDYVDKIVVVDDGSTDGTWKVISSTSDARLVPLRYDRTSGVGGAIVAGHKKMLELGMDVSAVLAGDGQMDPAFLPDLLSAVVDEGYDYSKGNRFLKPGHLKGMPKHRVVGNFLLTLMTKFASGYWNIFDPQNGFTCIRTSALRELDLDHLSKGYNFENDILVHLNVMGASVKDVPCHIRYDGQDSGIKPFRFLARSVGFLSKRFAYRLYKKYIVYDFGPYPLLFFPGLVLFLMGFFYGVDIVYLRYFAPGRAIATTGTILLSVVGLVMGMQLLLTAFIFDTLQIPKPRGRSGDRT